MELSVPSPRAGSPSPHSPLKATFLCTLHSKSPVQARVGAGSPGVVVCRTFWGELSPEGHSHASKRSLRCHLCGQERARTAGGTRPGQAERNTPSQRLLPRAACLSHIGGRTPPTHVSQRRRRTDPAVLNGAGHHARGTERVHTAQGLSKRQARWDTASLSQPTAGPGGREAQPRPLPGRASPYYGVGELGWGSIPDSPERTLRCEPGKKGAGGRGSRWRDQRVPRVGVPTR